MTIGKKFYGLLDIGRTSQASVNTSRSVFVPRFHYSNKRGATSLQVHEQARTSSCLII